jgi:hypothetical protein
MADNWSMKEIVRRWHQLYLGTLLSQKYQRGDALSKSEMISLEETVTIYRQRWYDISWLMRNLNEHTSGEANKKDGCTGRFWEGRFKSQALLDESAVLACMAYVDLNPFAPKWKPPQKHQNTPVSSNIILGLLFRSWNEIQHGYWLRNLHIF